MGYKSRTIYATGKGQDDCVCFKGEECGTYPDCKGCIKIQGKYTNWKPKLWTDRFKPYKPFLEVLDEQAHKNSI